VDESRTTTGSLDDSFVRLCFSFGEDEEDDDDEDVELDFEDRYSDRELLRLSLERELVVV